MRNSNEISAIILAGGRGGAFSPLSDYMPKSLAFVGTKPIIHHILDSLAPVPINTVYVVVGRFGEMIKRYVLDTRSIDRAVEFLESDLIDNTGGCLLRVKDFVKNPFLVYFGDVLVKEFDFSAMIDLHRQMHKRHGALGTLAYSRHHPLGVGILRIDGGRKQLLAVQEKPSTEIFNVNMAISLFEPGLFRYIWDPSDDLYATVIPRALDSGEKFTVFEHGESWWHIHTVADLHKEHVGGYERWIGTPKGS